MKAVVIIPARYASTRLPFKVILPEVKSVTGRYIIEHVYQNVKQARRIHKVIVATDSQLIYDIVKGFGGEAEMTSALHTSGTDRIAEVAGRLDADIIVNVQGDEPEMHASVVDQVIDTLVGDDVAVMATVANAITDAAELRNPNVVKVVLDNRGYALYFSRSQIPYVRDSSDLVNEPGITFLRHLGIYAYQRDFLLQYSKLPASSLEHAEKLEQLRALANGYKIKVAITQYTSRGIDTRDDLMTFLERYRHD
ncbi:3-deoxy-manno-octulosonate cytidylyltransferase [Candidatus Brocadia sinica]|uniref:3-deoxy-manno-octulosonate cytidylyltransferase n=1 Tax=Candidatus Brocadia sinica JPN1 TaxID=1197129 RepID=A0ABQ0JVW4_9BACT|nr:3-deoxy-manno-octulosonate cytidylyltransferase [Candidatus Brocadia sinica]MBL1167268.1 3-deoxy-manno-octulosonate cytidylyltransferase [Candidatus Brocadia sp. AMX1]NOG41259.1 3-deoxy-manno-octulosonate cytidylyltransferase [Planctomycetota bacterium]GAN32906.1 3-deoxy-manno-octulosonate cytidylyltransferase [Candidatus Brocadia sinica JPN1]GIK14526.1 MAG: 3-deoxy-manno-octulosonate cytidylyltransferase [Candidatus Brocadia sinica]GJQ16213.1 MAG: 3-deoxy-manno-octulosonate cytidylyltransf